MDCFKSF